MQTTPTQITPPPQSSQTRANIELIIFGYLVSLTIKGALDTAFGKTIPQHVTSTRGLLAAILVFPAIQLLVFLLTLVRFIYGAYRFQEEGPGKLTGGVLLWNIIGTLVLFVLFYISSLSILHAAPFYAGMGAIHFWDMLWFLGIFIRPKDIKPKIKKVMGKFILIDFGTIVCLLLSHFLFKNNFMGAASTVMATFAVIDVIVNFSFFFKPEEWRTSTT